MPNSQTWRARSHEWLEIAKRLRHRKARNRMKVVDRCEVIGSQAGARDLGMFKAVAAAARHSQDKTADVVVDFSNNTVAGPFALGHDEIGRPGSMTEKNPEKIPQAVANHQWAILYRDIITGEPTKPGSSYW